MSHDKDNLTQISLVNTFRKVILESYIPGYRFTEAKHTDVR